MLLIGANSAWATCGDYLAHSSPAATEGRPTTAPPLPLPQPHRCTGPQCRQAPLTPDLPTAPVTTPVRSDRVIDRRVPLSVETSAGASAGLAREPDARPVAGAAVGIDHIPRAV
jgi:hypothetical protein